VLVDTGHHPLGTNVEQIGAVLLAEGLLGGFQAAMNIQTAYAKALLVDEAAVAEAQRAGDVLGAHRLLLQAYETDVRPLLAQLREEQGLDADPVEAFRRSGHAERLARERGTASVESAYETL
jgi:L-rhamnose isomerase/sugar isomerase